MLTDARLTTRHHADYSVVTLRGEFDVASRDRLSEQLREAMHASPAGTVLVDLAGVEFMDCTALGVLVHAYRRATRHGLRMVLVRPANAVQRLLAITRIDRTIPTRANLQAALNAPAITLHTPDSPDRRFAQPPGERTDAGEGSVVVRWLLTTKPLFANTETVLTGVGHLISGALGEHVPEDTHPTATPFGLLIGRLIVLG